MKRIMVVGCPGAGKSTAAARIAEITRLPVIHLDLYYWLPGRTPRELDDWKRTQNQLASRPVWVMDGNYGSSLHIRLARADTVIHLDYSTFVCASRLVRRALSGRSAAANGQLPDGGMKRLEWPFFWFVLGYRRTRRPRDLRALADFRGKLHRFARPRELEAFLSELGGQPTR
ncbi:MAG: adenylate kinase [Pseudomonadota bacterium]